MLSLMKTVGLTLCMVCLLSAADVDGVWKADYTTPDGTQRQSTFHLKADGGALNGKVVSAMGEAPVKDGRVSGEDISFTVVRNFNGNEITLKYTGKVSKDQMELKVHFNENSFDIIAKRQPS